MIYELYRLSDVIPDLTGIYNKYYINAPVETSAKFLLIPSSFSRLIWFFQERYATSFNPNNTSHRSLDIAFLVNTVQILKQVEDDN